MSATARASELREDLLDAAARVLEQHGPPAVTTRRIAREAGCSEGSIYNHFANKDALIASVVSERIARFPALISELAATAGQGEVRDQLTEVAWLATDFFRRGMPMLGVAANDPETIRRHCQALHTAGHGPARTTANLAAWLGAEQQLGRIHPHADPDGIATALLGSCMFHVMVSTTWGAELAPDDTTAIRRTVDAVWCGMAPEDR